MHELISADQSGEGREFRGVGNDAGSASCVGMERVASNTTALRRHATCTEEMKTVCCEFSEVGRSRRVGGGPW